ncbi:hypothetical protein ACHAP8_012497 [Fusarium lateritium]
MAVNSDDGMSETSTLSGETTTSDISGATSITIIDESYADSATSSVSSTATLFETSIAAISTELSSTETLSQSPTATILRKESTSTALAPSTTSVEAPLGTSPNVIYLDECYEKEVWLPVEDYETSITSDVEKESSGALFGLEPTTSRLYAVLPSGEKRYAASCTQCSRDSIWFFNEEQRAARYFVRFLKCTEGDNRYLNCGVEVEGDPYTRMYFYEVAGYYMQTQYSDLNGGAAIQFRFG